MTIMVRDKDVPTTSGKVSSGAAEEMYQPVRTPDAVKVSEGSASAPAAVVMMSGRLSTAAEGARPNAI